MSSRCTSQAPQNMMVYSPRLCRSLVITCWTSLETYSGQSPVLSLDHEFLTIASLARQRSKASPTMLGMKGNETTSST